MSDIGLAPVTGNVPGSAAVPSTPPGSIVAVAVAAWMVVVVVGAAVVVVVGAIVVVVVGAAAVVVVVGTGNAASS